jgi:chromosome segregation ATPase
LKAADHQNEVSLGQARDLETLKRDLDKLEAANKALSAQLRETKDALTEVTESRNQYRDSSESLDAKCKELEARLATALAEAKTATEQSNATRKRFDGMEANIRVRRSRTWSSGGLTSAHAAVLIHLGGDARARRVEDVVERQRNGEFPEANDD